MSTSATIPVFDPQGVLRDIPEGQLASAVKAGGMPAVRFQAPDKSIRYVPASRTQEASQAGGKILPFEQQDVKHPGFWAALYDDAKGITGGMAKMATTGGNIPAMVGAAAEMGGTVAENIQHRKDEGRSAAYQAIAPVGDLIGVNTRGMEDAADAGDVGGVAGHAAAVPAAMAVTEGVARAVPIVKPYVSTAADAVAPVVKAAAGKVPEAVGAAAGAYAGHATGIPEGGLIGAFAGRQLAAKLVDVFSKSPQKFAEELDATGENKPFAGGMDEHIPKKYTELDATRENKPFAGGMDEAIPAKASPVAAPAVAPGQAGSMAESVAIPKRYTPPEAPPARPAPPSSTQSHPPAPSGDAVLDRLRNFAAAPKTAEVAPEGDLLDLLNESMKPENLAKFRARKAAATVQ